MRIVSIARPLNAIVRVPGSKSLTNRALLIASLANGQTKLTNALFSDDSKYFARALQTLGFDVQLDEANSEMTVTGLGGDIPVRQANLFIGNAGTAARFLTAFVKLGHGEYILDGDSRMRERPIGGLLQALNKLTDKDQPIITDPWTLVPDYSHVCLPVLINAYGLYGGKTRVAGNISSQYLSALLMIAPYAQTSVEIELATDLNSKPYVDMTLSMMKDFGVEVQRDGYKAFVIPTASYQVPISAYSIESDASAASYFFAAPAICGGTVKVESISRNSVQGDIKFLDVLSEMGCMVAEEGNSLIVTCNSRLKGLDVNLRDLPDTAQTLAAIAPFASTPTRIRGIASARHKETDRIHATCAELARLGVQVDEHEDGMTIYPASNLQPANIQTYNDHRMAMSFSLIGLRFDGVTIENPSCVSKTFPNFFDVLESLR
ncbi:MAG: 3-phosphoshikimate 1-carboxyvinyltransferase [Anaerolineales bacterium]|nr:3-phosphoshikimate 1-carboxyvinyltransferase [Anaerolineales bacterium]MCL4259870.1 3-phosphoshikimate 1-carboxyvinyltransferase [Anaerolineales bacterium]